ncbi:MAG: cupin domain-containing protein [candidate division Zixibacteria bacterium]|nr:cupin domain-containing protein [candidate division Zixibacteria bacterium]
MLIKDLKNCPEIIAGDNTQLRELLNPLNDNVNIRYSLAQAVVKPGNTTLAHRLKSSELYYILEGEGEMYIDDEVEKVASGQAIYIPPDSNQKITNTGSTDLIFICIVDPAWRFDDEEVLD